MSILLLLAPWPCLLLPILYLPFRSYHSFLRSSCDDADAGEIPLFKSAPCFLHQVKLSTVKRQVLPQETFSFPSPGSFGDQYSILCTFSPLCPPPLSFWQLSWIVLQFWLCLGIVNIIGLFCVADLRTLVQLPYPWLQLPESQWTRLWQVQSS